jgi:hypothetical protein
LFDVVLLELTGDREEQVMRMVGIDRDRPQIEREVIARVDPWNVFERIAAMS